MKTDSRDETYSKMNSLILHQMEETARINREANAHRFPWLPLVTIMLSLLSFAGGIAALVIALSL